jgi:hypothetical protein
MVAALAMTGCSNEPPCSGAFTVDMPADTPGAPDPRAALETWLDGTSPVGEAPTSAPTKGWVDRGSDDADRVQLENGRWHVTVWRTTNAEWIVTTLGCR